MLVPEAPALTPLEHITPSIYEASTGCLAKAAWYAKGGRGILPEHPAAILGTSFHAVLAAANRGSLAVAGASDRAPARQLFDETARTIYSQAHPLVRLKFPTPERLPFYNLHRERAAIIATRIASGRSSVVNSSTGATAAPAPRTESRLCSTDGLIVGRPDQLDGEVQAVVDYKSGHVAEPEAGVVTDAEARQLRLYAYLAMQSGITVSKGMIVRADGRPCELPIASKHAEEEAEKARNRLRALNAAVNAGSRFHDLASPSPQHCRSCPCIPFCDPFWAYAAQEWGGECGRHVEGKVLEAESRCIQGVSLTTLLIEVQAGTVSAPRASVEQIPTEWLNVEGGGVPRTGDVIRVVHGRLTSADEGAAVVRVDKTATAVWRVRSESEVFGA